MQAASSRRAPKPFADLLVINPTHVQNGPFRTTILLDLFLSAYVDSVLQTNCSGYSGGFGTSRWGKHHGSGGGRAIGPAEATGRLALGRQPSTVLMGDFLSLAQRNLPVTVVACNNGALGFIELEQKSQGFLKYRKSRT